MFGRKKNETTEMTKKTGSTTSSQYSSVKTSNIVEQRIIAHRTTSSYISSTTTSKREVVSAPKANINGIPKVIPSISILDTSPNKIYSARDRLKSIPDVDAKPYKTTNMQLTKSSSTSNIGYQSPFSRKLTPLTSTDARPTVTRPTLNSSTLTSRTSPPNPFPRNVPSYASYHSQPTTSSSHLLSATSNYLPTTVSTQSLPSSSELNQQRDPRIPTYNTNGKKRGKVLVINNIKFLQEKVDRKGAEIDEKNINKLFNSMGFDVDIFRDLKQSAMLEKVKKFKNDSSLKKVDISITIMMSHGNNVDNTGKVIRGGFTQIYGVDDKGLPIEDILNEFSSEGCPTMAGKPKIFIFQCCRGDNSETLHNDATPMRDVVKKHADMLIAFSTLPGFYSIRDTLQGSWYIQCICEVFKKYAQEFDVEQLLKIVDDQLSKKHPKYQQTSTYESRGFKRCYLNPK